MTPASRRLSGRFWVIPAGAAVASLLAAYGLARLDRLIGDTGSAFLFPGPPSGARSFLGAVISAMISFTGLVFSITVVVLVLTSGQFSPRVLRRFLQDRTIQSSLGLFVATFLFAMTSLREVLGSDGAGAFVPRISVTVAFVLVLASVTMFVYYINHIIHMIQASSIIVSIGDETRALIDARYPTDPVPAGPAHSPAPHPVPVPTSTPGVITAVDENGLIARARRDGLVVVVAVRVGDFLPAGATLLTLHGEPPDGPQVFSGYAGLICQDSERTMDQDVAFGFRQLVDVATRALSPSVNDPTTACQVVDVLHDLLRRLVTRPVEPARHTDAGGATRLVIPSYDVADLLDTTLAEVWHYGSGSTQIPERLGSMLDDLHRAARPEHREAVATWLDTVRATTWPSASPVATNHPAAGAHVAP